jgi:hypothetical protein
LETGEKEALPSHESSYARFLGIKIVFLPTLSLSSQLPYPQMKVLSFSSISPYLLLKLSSFFLFHPMHSDVLILTRTPASSSHFNLRSECPSLI